MIPFLIALVLAPIPFVAVVVPLAILAHGSDR